jgi:hypothetical protein
MPSGFSMTSLFWRLDEEGDPTLAVAYLLKAEDGEAHAVFDWKKEDFLERQQDERPIVRIGPNSGTLEAHSGRLKKLKWPRGIVRLAYRSLSKSMPADSQKSLREMSSDEIAIFPAEPIETFSVAEVRSMTSFCGVYLAYNDDGSCHYVGESKDVTSRIAKSREEIGDRRIGIVRCEPHDRKRIEAYFAAMLDPPGNAISTHRMKLSAVKK